ncbi:MAG: four helix bundle protein [Patescibacteria group bacterium]|jgi:hypothetical protein
MTDKIKSFTDLIAWQKSRVLAKEIYQTTESFPSKEVYGLTNQIRRAAISVVSNIAEGFSRRSKAEKSQFYSISKGSLTELQAQLIVASDIGYLKIDIYQKLSVMTDDCSRLLTGLLRSTESK